MQALAHVCGLSLVFSEDRQELTLGDDLLCQTSRAVKLSELVPTLLNKSLRYPENVYSHHEGVVRREDQLSGKWLPQFKYDIYVLPFGLLGIEYIKTHVYYGSQPPAQLACIIEVTYGEITLILQRNQPKTELDFDTHVEEAIVVTIHAGERAGIPNGYFFTFVNASNNTVIFSILRTKEQVVDYRSLNREQGLAYFMIAKNARAEVVTNPRYRTTPPIRASQSPEVVELKLEKPLYDSVVETPQQFLNMLSGAELAVA